MADRRGEARAVQQLASRFQRRNLILCKAAAAAATSESIRPTGFFDRVSGEKKEKKRLDYQRRSTPVVTHTVLPNVKSCRLRPSAITILLFQLRSRRQTKTALIQGYCVAVVVLVVLVVSCCRCRCCEQQSVADIYKDSGVGTAERLERSPQRPLVRRESLSRRSVSAMFGIWETGGGVGRERLRVGWGDLLLCAYSQQSG